MRTVLTLDHRTVWPCEIGEPVVILPYYGEFGHFVNSYIRQVEYIGATHKIVCCHPGDEIYFPSANGFYSEWIEKYSANERVGYRNCWPPSAAYVPDADEEELVERLVRRFPGHRILYLAEPLDDPQVVDMPIRIAGGSVPIPRLDIAVCCRRRKWDEYRNFEQWDDVLAPLAAAGFAIGVVGEKETSCDFEFLRFRSWEYSPNSLAVVDAISTARLYIGTDTGPSHLAAIVAQALLLFRNETCPNKNYLRDLVSVVAGKRGIPVTYLEDGWTDPAQITRAASLFLIGPRTS